MEAMERYLQTLDDPLIHSTSGEGFGRGEAEAFPEEEEGVWETLGEILARRTALRESPTEEKSVPRAAARKRSAPGVAVRAGTKDAVGLYLADIRRYRLLNREEEIHYASAAQAGERQARDVLITRNLRLVVSIAKRYQGLGLSFPDLIEEGNLGLIRSIDRFDCGRGLRFSTYASKWIRQSITRALVNKSRTVRIPSNVLALLKKIAQIQRSVFQENGRRATYEEICRRLRISIHRLAEVYGLLQSTLSLDHPVDPGSGRHRLHEVLPEKRTSDPADDALKTLERGHVAGLLCQLAPREERILRLRFGFDGGDPRSLEETGVVLGVTRERVRQIEGRALVKLRKFVVTAEAGA